MSTNPIKIAVGYKCGSGKDTFCNYIMDKFKDKKCNRISFADPVYSILAAAQEICNLPKTKDRQFLQFIGNDWGRKIDPDLWIKIAMSKSNNNDISLISDLRYNNEFQTLKENGWFNVKIINNNISPSRIGNGNKNHISETELDIVHDLCWDYIIYNNGTLEEFYHNIDIMLKEKFLL